MQATVSKKRILCAVVLALVLGAPDRAPAGEEQPLTLHGWLESKGRETSYSARKTAFERTYVGEDYRGTLEQNVRWLRHLRGLAPVEPGKHVPATKRHAALRRYALKGWTLTLDPRKQVLRLDVPKDERIEQVLESDAARIGTDVRGEPPLRARIELAEDAYFVPAGVLALKAKQFDDGLYAAVELAAYHGRGRFPGKRVLLDRLFHRLRKQGACAPGNGPAVFFAATSIGPPLYKAPACVAEATKRVRRGFLADELRSKPLGFYTWYPLLRQVFQQDRLLQTRLVGDEGIAALVAALEDDSAVRSAYAATLRLNARLTNPPVAQDLTARYGGKQPALPRKGIRFYPPSRSHEVTLAERLWGDKPVPAGADLMNELIGRVQAGSLSLAVRPDSGWYDHQTWALEPLLRPDQVPESARLAFTPRYRAYLVDLFKGTLALTRETHVKQLDLGACGAMMPPPTFHVSPGLSVEPLATHYKRRADAYRFVRGVLAEAFGPGALAGMRRETADGAVRLDLDTELRFMERLFDGAAQTAWAQIGAEQAGHGEQVGFDRFLFRTWAGRLEHDPDVGRDARMMVPVFWDEARKQMKVWAFLGWQERPLTISYEKPPAIGALHGPEGKSSEQPEVRFHTQHLKIPCPVMAEVYVRRLLDRDEFRAHCDKYKTRAGILRNLR